MRSLLDDDFYKLLMCQSIFRNSPDTTVTFSLINRSSKIRLAEVIDERELRDLLYTGVNHSGPFALRYPRGAGTGASTAEPMRQLPIGRGEVLREGRDVTLVGFGTSVSECLLAAGILEQAGIDAAVINARYAKPLDEELLLRYARTTGGLVTAEENVRAGGFGDAVLELLADNGLATKNLANLAMPDQIVDHGPQATFRQIYQLDAAGIAARAKALLGASPSAPSSGSGCSAPSAKVIASAFSSSTVTTCGTMISGCTTMPSFVHSAAASRMAVSSSPRNTETMAGGASVWPRRRSLDAPETLSLTRS